MSGDGAIVFFHAHPDDESIFTGGTIARCVAAGQRTVLVVATSGDLGLPCRRCPCSLTTCREHETRHAASILGVHRVEFLRYPESGMRGDPRNNAAGRFSTLDADQVARRVAAILGEERATALVTYDRHGIYGHPDHIKVHSVGRLAAELATVGTVYEATVDREYLHFVEPHLVEQASRGRARELGVGAPSVAITTTVPVGRHLAAKRSAIRAHRSQVPAAEIEADVYGFEWFIRRGAAGMLDELAV
jgi:LmbE family N-acetylglucosaminyl deacetylase